jgi:hypothetical protein
MSEYEQTIWLKALSSCPLGEVEKAMSDFVETASREDARGVTLGEINSRIDRFAEARNAAYIADQNRRNRERWKAEQDADIARDPEEFERARLEAQEKFRKMFGKSLEQVVADTKPEVEAAGIVDATDERA